MHKKDGRKDMAADAVIFIQGVADVVGHGLSAPDNSTQHATFLSKPNPCSQYLYVHKMIVSLVVQQRRHPLIGSPDGSRIRPCDGLIFIKHFAIRFTAPSMTTQLINLYLICESLFGNRLNSLDITSLPSYYT